MHGNTCEYWNRNNMHLKFGYDHFYCYKEYDLSDRIGLGLSDKSFFNQSVDFIKEIDETYDKYYGTLIMLTNHAPFYNEGKVDFDVSYLEGTNIGDYIKLLHYADEAIGEFINKLDENNLLDDTVIVIYGDHDSKLKTKEYEYYLNYDLENNKILDKNNENYIDIDFYKYEDLTKVPLIIWTKDKVVQGNITEVMGTYDVLPTLGNMFGFESKYQLGNDIFSVDENIVVFPNGNWRTNKVYYNGQNKEYKLLTDEEVSDEYLKQKEEYARKIVETSNNLIKYNLFN
jgi:phosphoglycerol transferase MdoB-like AlkP superfamily enzyme